VTGTDRSSSGDEVRIRELAKFLRERRARLDPEQLGFPARRRRRTPGLRREDVAERAAVSVAWYTSLEQGRPVNPSKAVVASLADALCLGDVDRAYLFKLAGHPPPPVTESPGLDARLLQSLVDHVEAPAYCTDALTNVMAWNATACEVFGDYGRWPPERRNLLSLLFDEPEFAERLADRDDYAERVVRTFRGRSNAHRDDPIAIELVATLSRRSERFRSLWNRHDIRQTETDRLEVVHPRGLLTFTMTSWQAVATSGLRLSVYLPADDATARASLTPDGGRFEPRAGASDLASSPLFRDA
jgi:transcriptional regulator with XRE-family HTH domain